MQHLELQLSEQLAWENNIVLFERPINVSDVCARVFSKHSPSYIIQLSRSVYFL